MQAPVAIVVLRGPGHVIELANPVACALWGREQSSLVNRPLFDALPELRGQPWKDLLDRVFRTGEPYNGTEAPVVLATISFNFVCTPLRNARNEVDGILVVATDVAAEARARQDIDRLRREAERATKAKDRFLAVLSHELRTPLTSLFLQLELLRRRTRWTPDLGIIIDAMERAVKTQSRLTDDLLDVSRIVAGKLEIEMRPLEFMTVVREAIDTVRPLAEHKEVDLEVKLDTGFLPVMGDAPRLRQAVWNLLVNAVKFTPPEGLVRIELSSDPGSVRLAIGDSGAGIAPECLSHVFDLFTQGGADDKGGGGLGLGLTIVRHVVELHHGSVKAESPGVGRGATFTVTLPVLTTSAEERAMPPHERPDVPPHHVPLAGLQVLLLEDDPEIREPLRAMLTEAGAVVVAMWSAEEALRVLDRITPNLLVCDIALPGQSGLDFLRQVRAREKDRGDDIPALALTARASEHHRRESYAAGFQHHLSKPVRFDELIKAVLTLTGRSS
jgi:signal transduction histidine kinase/ActR/RegA family two-component response regulator